MTYQSIPSFLCSSSFKVEIQTKLGMSDGGNPGGRESGGTMEAREVGEKRLMWRGNNGGIWGYNLEDNGISVVSLLQLQNI